MKKVHKEDKNLMVNFIDNARLNKPENVKLEIYARHLAEHLGLNPDVNNGRLANKFELILK